MDIKMNDSADRFLQTLEESLVRMNSILRRDHETKLSRSYDFSSVRSSPSLSTRHYEDGDLKPLPSGDIDHERRSRSHSPRRDSKSPTRTAMNLSTSLDRTPSYEDLSVSLPPGRPVPLTGRFSPSPLDRSVSPIRASPSLEQAENPEDRLSHSQDRSSRPQQRSSSPYERSRQYSEGKDFLYNRPRRSFTPERLSRSDLGNLPADSTQVHQVPERPSSSMERTNPHERSDWHDRSSRSADRSQSALESPDRHSLQYEQSRPSRQHTRSSPVLDRSRQNGSHERQRSHQDETAARNEMTENGRKGERVSTTYSRPERPRSAQERTRTLPERPTPSEEPPSLSHGRASPILNGRGSLRNSEDKLSVSFQDDPSSYQDKGHQDGRRSPSHLDLAYNRKKPPIRSSWVAPEPHGNTQENGETKKEQTPKSIRRSLLDMRTAEKQLKEYRALVEDAKTQLMLTEFKRDNTQKDLERMKEDLNRRKREMKNCEDQLRSRVGELRQIDTTQGDDKTVALIKENESLKHRLRQADGLELERDELVRQLELAKEDLFNEQRQSRHKIEELKEEIENLTSQIDENKNMQDEQNLQNIMTRTEGLELRQTSARESEELHKQTRDLRRNIESLQEDMKRKEDINRKLREQTIELRKQLEKETSSKENFMDDHKRSLQSLRKEMDSAMVQLKESLFLDKQQSLEELRSELERERREASSRAEDKLTNSLSEHQDIIQKKEEEVKSLMQVIRKLEEDSAALEQRVKVEATQKIEEALTKERQKSEFDQDLRIRRERELLQNENKQRVKDLINELEQERKLRENLCQQMTQDLEEQKHQNNMVARDRMLAVNRARDQMRHEMLQEIDRTKEKLKQEHRQEIDRLQETIRQQEEELCQLRAERKLYVRPELENTLERVERTIVNEINEECRRNSNVIGVSPRKVNLNTFRVENNGYTPNGRSRTPTTAALANLRACNQDLRNHVHELKQEIQHQKSAMMRNEREKDELIKNVKFQIEREKNSELEKMKQRITKEYTGKISSLNQKCLDQTNGHAKELQEKIEELEKVKESFDKWRRETDSMMNRLESTCLRGKQYNSSKQHVRVPPYQYSHREDMQQQEIERLERQIKYLADTQRRMMHTPVTKDPETDKMINQLQSKMVHLQEENNALRNSKYNSYSVPDLSNPVLYKSVQQRPLSSTRLTHQEKLASFLEQRSREGILDSETVEEHQKMNRNMMSQKMAEMTRLQNSLTNQAEDLIHLSKSYQQLNSRSSSPVRDFIKS